MFHHQIAKIPSINPMRNTSFLPCYIVVVSALSSKKIDTLRASLFGDESVLLTVFQTSEKNRSLHHMGFKFPLVFSVGKVII